jgi:uncharacterized repeat protein (TIGR01451 family)
MSFPLGKLLKAKKSKQDLGTRNHRRAARVPPTRFVPRLEALEDRTLPSVLTVMNNSDSGVAGDGSLRGEIAIAQDGDTINFASSLAGQTISLTSGELLVTQNISIVGLTNGGAPAITINANHNSRVFDIKNSGIANVSLSNLTITGGAAGSNSPSFAAEGGGLLIDTDGGTVTLNNVIVTGNNVDISLDSSNSPGFGQGGGIAFVGGNNAKIVLMNGMVKANAARGLGGAEGGGIYAVGGTVTLTNESVTYNTAQGNAGGMGVAPTTKSGKLGLGGAGGTGGQAQGGGLYVTACTVDLTNDKITNNKAQGGTGGTGGSNGGAGGTGGQAQGGGLYIAGSVVTFAQNLSIGYGLEGDSANGGNGGNGGKGIVSALGGKNSGGTGGNGGIGYGGGIYLAGGTVNMTGVNADFNYAYGGFGGSGGGGGLLTSKGGIAGGGGGDGGNAFGGGLYVANGVVTLTDDNLDNEAGSAIGAIGGFAGDGHLGVGQDANGGSGGGGGTGYGGWIYVLTGTVTLTDDILSHGAATGGFGGVGGFPSGPSVTKTVTSTGTKFKYKYPVSGDGGVGGYAFGGGLYIAGGNVALIDDSLIGNQAQGEQGGVGGGLGGGGAGGAGGGGYGGGVYVAGGVVTMTNDTLSGDALNSSSNEAIGGVGGSGGYGAYHTSGGHPGGAGGAGGDAFGGGLFVANGIVSLTNDTLGNNSTYAGNGGHGGDGGTGYNTKGSKVLVPAGNGGNGGNGMGGGLYFLTGTLSLANTLIAQNSVALGNGGEGGYGNAVHSFGPTGSAGAEGSVSGPDVFGSPTSSDHDLIGNTSGSGGFSASNGDILNPAVVGLATYFNQLPYGGPIPTLALLAGSPAIDAGDSAAPGLPATDEQGFARIVGAAVDIGAYEYGATAATADLSIGGSASPTVSAGGQITYNLTVTNNSSTAQSNVTVADELPTNTTLVAWTPAAGWSSSAPAVGSGTGTVSAWIISLAAGTSANFTLVVQVNSGTPVGTVISNTASVGPITGDPTPADNSVTLSTTVQPSGPVDVSSDVSLTRSGFHYNLALHEFVQTITITNTSGSALIGPLALELTNLSSNATLANASGTVNGNPYIDFVSSSGQLAAGQSITVTLYFKDPTFQSIIYGIKVLQGL